MVKSTEIRRSTRLLSPATGRCAFGSTVPVHYLKPPRPAREGPRPSNRPVARSLSTEQLLPGERAPDCLRHAREDGCVLVVAWITRGSGIESALWPDQCAPAGIAVCHSSGVDNGSLQSPLGRADVGLVACFLVPLEFKSGPSDSRIIFDDRIGRLGYQRLVLGEELWALWD